MKKPSLFEIVIVALVVIAVIAFTWSFSPVNNNQPSNTLQRLPVQSSPSSSQPQPASNQKISPTAPPPSTPKNWHTVMTLSGSGQENTAPFTIQGSEWRVDWTETLIHDPASFCEQGGPCTVTVFTSLAGQTQAAGVFSMTTMSAIGTVTGTSYEYLASGSYYLFINPDFSPQWSVTVRDYY